MKLEYVATPSPSIPQPVATGHWWRYNKYEFYGTHIRPAPGAHLEPYDPWESFESTKRTRRDYLDLVRLSEAASSTYNSVAPGARDDVLAWCSQHGLLGVLLHDTLQVTFPLRWNYVPYVDANKPALLPTSHTFTRASDGWMHSAFRTDKPSFEIARANTQVTEAEFLENASPPKVIVRRPNDPRIREESDVEATWGKFFPDRSRFNCPEVGYPVPFEEEFLYAYAEGIGAFMNAARMLRDLVRSLELIRTKTGTPEEFASLRSRYISDYLVSPISQTIVADADGKLSIRWVCGSLLATYARMAINDYLGPDIPTQCAVCGNYFYAKKGALYCSLRCRKTNEKRRQRGREKSAST